ncbi:MAG: hypothetical protein ACRBCL_16730 [Maritimibacter sp.]
MPELIEDLEAARDEDGRVLLRGFLTRGLYRSDIRESLALQGVEVTGPLYVVEAYFGDRSESIDAKVRTDLVFVLVVCFLTFAVWSLAIWKFVIWRKRVKAKRGAQPKRKAARERKPSTVRAKDAADDSPIKSKKGLFR